MLRTFALATACLIAAFVAPSRGGDDPKAAVSLSRLTWADFQKHLATPNGAKYTLVDAWSTTCGPCKENFPHLVEMDRKYAAKGLAVVSLSLDDKEDAKALGDARKFLADKKATFTNVLLDEDYGVGFEKLDINAIPAVFLFDQNGKEVKRFTMDDPNHQFTYDEVEKEVIARLDGAK